MRSKRRCSQAMTALNSVSRSSAPSSTNLNLPDRSRDVVDDMPENVTDLPDYLSDRRNPGVDEKIRDTYENQKAEQEADQARYDAGLAANPQLADLVENTSTETATLRQQVKTDADAILSGAAALAADAAGMKLVAADWQNGEDGSTFALKKDTAYIIHALSNLQTSAAVTDGTETPPVQTVDKTALEAAIGAKKPSIPRSTPTTPSPACRRRSQTRRPCRRTTPHQTEVDAAAQGAGRRRQGLKKDDPSSRRPPCKRRSATLRPWTPRKYTEESVAAMQEALEQGRRREQRTRRARRPRSTLPRRRSERRYRRARRKSPDPTSTRPRC